MADRKETLKLEVFDRPMCCSSGVCGPNVDPKLVQFSADLEWVRSRGIQVERYNPSRQYQAFADNDTVVKAISDGGLSCLPLVLVNGLIVSGGVYPAIEQLALMTGLADEALVVSHVGGPQPE